jgi:hypothetical protein
VTERDRSSTRTALGRRSLVPVAAGATALGVCCGLPLLASLGVAGVITGLGIGSWIAVVVASLAAVIGALRWRRRRVSCETKRADAGTGSSSAAIGGMTLDPRAGR